MLQHRTKERMEEVILFTFTIFGFHKPIISKTQTLNDACAFKEVVVWEEKKG